MLRVARLSLCWVLLNIYLTSALPSASIPSIVNKPFEQSVDGLYADEVIIDDLSDMSDLTEVVTPAPSFTKHFDQYRLSSLPTVDFLTDWLCLVFLPNGSKLLLL
ncbi:hypothetical protein MHU86_4586 [Fragilaria crotonensis]|nr:hypothetical protein MHU86_4586 [Fragilaria crotonensis]